MNIKENTMKQGIFSDLNSIFAHLFLKFPNKIDLFQPLKSWCNQLTIQDPVTAHWICRLIPPQCPFARTITLFGWKILTIPPLCELNPLYNEFVFLRFRALCYLVEECGEDGSQYC
jgi:hypothetical protein